MERHGDHRLNGRQIDLDHTVVVSHFTRIEFLIISRTAVDIKEVLHFIISLPDGRQACGLGSHDIYTDTEISGKSCHTGADELHDLILYIAVSENRANDGQCHVLRTDTLHRGTL